MFNGIIRQQAKVSAITFNPRRTHAMLELVLPASVSSQLKIGGSLAVDGTCLTLTRKVGRKARFDVIRETLKRTTLGHFKKGEAVNIELPTRAGEPLDGHVVQGHVDGVGIIQTLKKDAAQISFLVKASPNIARKIREKGSIAINGVSLTLGKIGPKGFWIHCIPHTLKLTNLRDFTPGRKVNLETDHFQK